MKAFFFHDGTFDNLNCVEQQKELTRFVDEEWGIVGGLLLI
jgi:hypothetical protein